MRNYIGIFDDILVKYCFGAVVAEIIHKKDVDKGIGMWYIGYEIFD